MPGCCLSVVNLSVNILAHHHHIGRTVISLDA